MNKRVIIDVGLTEERVAIFEDNRMVEIHIERIEDDKIVGNIYKGRAINVLPGIEAAFIDIGIEKNAFLHLEKTSQESNEKESVSMGQSNSLLALDNIKNNQEVMVQVVKEAIIPKGARVTTNISLPGRYLVFIPNSSNLGISHRIEDEKERERLKKIIQSIRPKNVGLIIRTAAWGKEEEDFLADLDFLMRLWKKISRRVKKAKAPMLLHEDLSLTYRIIRDLFTEEVDEIIINSKLIYKNMLKFLQTLSITELGPRVLLYSGEKPIFEEYGIEKEITKALQRKVWLKCGGYLIFDQAEALTVVDVNTGKFVGKKDMRKTILKTNLQAAEEIGLQLRLRDIGGIIIIDFIDMDNQEDKDKLIKQLEDSLKKDKTKTNVVQNSELGLVELTRKRSRRDLEKILRTACPYCSGTGRVLSSETVSNIVLRKLRELCHTSRAEAVLLAVHPKVEEMLSGLKMMLIKQLEKENKKTIYIISSKDIHLERIEVVAVGRKKEVKKIRKMSS
ncbi:MAG: Rne/Rng family ribonuclease [Candidatus Caldatribacteriota bacterium]|nr:Rne/Rng family ribonuclease [Candidatus Caldatribacteriota bacterium]